MKDLDFLIRNNKHLRNIRNNYQDYKSLTKYRFIKWKNKERKEPIKEPAPLLSKEEVEQKYKNILDENESKLNLKEFDSSTPLVSIIIVNRNGLNHLENLFPDFQENIQYPNYEILVVDNASTDGSVDFLGKLPLKVKIIRNKQNTSFSAANNQAVEEANGEFILLINNDIKPTYGWLNVMMQASQQAPDIGAVGAKLVYPYTPGNRNSFKIQHRGIAFRLDDGYLKPYNLGEGEEPFPSLEGEEPYHDESNQNSVRAGVTAATLLVRKDLYQEVGGLDTGYDYGYEDIDFCLKLYRKGYTNIYAPEALLFHYEFGTQEKDNKRKVKKRRQKNRALFKEKWGNWLYKHWLHDKVYREGLFSEEPLKAALVVTEVGEDASAGDYFTASELARCLELLGWEITYLVRRGPKNWYDADDDTDVVISFLEAYDPGKIMCSNPHLIKIAWARNWFERWVNNPSLKKYDLIFASSQTSCQYIEDETGLNTFLLPIATNRERFHDNIPIKEEYRNDYCFTGSYWDDPRDIVEYLDPEGLPYTFKLYGKNWQEFEKFKPYYEGFLEYNQLPEVYASSKIVIDDVNRGSKKFGAVNSRVYDALATGALIITNGEIGAKETFKGKLPYYTDGEDLNRLIRHYLTDDNARQEKIEELKEMVLEEHTYEIRARTVRDVIAREFIYKTRMAIKIPAPNWRSVREWGDYHLALSLKKELEKYNCQVILQVLPEWNNQKDRNCDVVLVLRGLSKYKPKKMHFNILWNISHPDEIGISEYNLYDQVFIASLPWADHIKDQTSVPVEALLQCTDPELFYPDPSEDFGYDLLFVGNSRKEHRKIIKDLLPTDHDLAVYGKNWKRFIKRRYIKGKYIPYTELGRVYSSCKILLNDHWHDMRGKGFLSNRIFDGYAAGAFIISDPVAGAEDVFGDCLITYQTPGELVDLIDHYLSDEDAQKNIAKKAQSIVLDHHTYQKRADQILKVIMDNNLIPGHRN